MATDVYSYIELSDLCCKHRHFNNYQRCLQLFPPSGLLRLIEISIYGFLTRNVQRIWLAIVIMDWYKKLARALPVLKVAVSIVTTVLLKSRVVPYRIQSTILFSAVLSMGTELGTTLKFHSQTSRPVECSNNTLVANFVTTVTSTREVGTSSFDRWRTNKLHQCTVRRRRRSLVWK